jgi:hypothetical protein
MMVDGGHQCARGGSLGKRLRACVRTRVETSRAHPRLAPPLLVQLLNASQQHAPSAQAHVCVPEISQHKHAIAMAGSAKVSHRRHRRTRLWHWGSRARWRAAAARARRGPCECGRGSRGAWRARRRRGCEGRAGRRQDVAVRDGRVRQGVRTPDGPPAAPEDVQGPLCDARLVSTRAPARGALGLSRRAQPVSALQLGVHTGACALMSASRALTTVTTPSSTR